MIKSLAMTGILAITVIAFTSCNNDENPNTNSNDPVRFTASIGTSAAIAIPVPTSRAAGATWDAADKIGIFMVDHGGTNVSEFAANRSYTTANGGMEGKFTPDTGQEIYYPVDNSPVDFIAYYPYDINARLTEPLPFHIATDQSDATAQPKCDLMWAHANNDEQGYMKSEGFPVFLYFTHRLARLTMNCKIDASVGGGLVRPDDPNPSVPEISTVVIKGMFTENTFSLTDGSLGTPEKQLDITARRLAKPSDTTKFAATYDAIIMPTAYEAGIVEVHFTVNGDTYVWKMDKTEFESGNDYIYEVTITRTDVKITSDKIKPWYPVQKDGVIAN